jgi:hypothetical protein
MNQYRCETCSKDHYCPIVHSADCVEKCDCWIKDVTSIIGCASHSDFQNQKEKVLDEYNDELLTKLVQELAGTWRMRDEKLFSIIRKYRRVPIGAMKAELMQSKDGEP